ncbi:crosslink repair DNA glycosylase YcaQ family protein [Patulibacter sp. SYSU D01012]|uniref:DNA glycosylase AlkZ-like family protein n=1 Tax=Patulibacter sp. SYSU D01012 TaxID=2817381 RepID=UPI001B310BD2|nr:crosslink repair DNA glycosylase YcaQ family protein [Patulibacter sp. SYSU D01012]
MTEATRERVLAFRVAGHHLDAPTDPATAVAACGLQEYPPGHAEVALHARAGDVAADDPVRRTWATVNAMRGAPYVVPRADVAVFTRALVPERDADLKGLVGSGPARELADAGVAVREALERVAAAARDGLADGPLDRDAFHQALRERLPPELLPWCRGCQSHHVRPALWRALGPLGVTEMPAKATWALAPDADARVDLDAARAELVRRFLRAYGPSTHSGLAAWAQTAPAHAKACLALVDDELQPVRVAGQRRWILAADAARLADPPAARGVRVLSGYDPYLAQPDRGDLVPDAATRKALFPAVGRPAVVLLDGRLAGLLRARKQGAVLRVRATWLGDPVPVEDALHAHARLRGCERAVLAD